MLGLGSVLCRKACNRNEGGQKQEPGHCDKDAMAEADYSHIP